MPRRINNRLLSLLSSVDLEQLQPWLEPVKLYKRSVPLVIGVTIENVYFVETGAVSMISLLEDGVQVEVGLVGPEGMLGLPLILGASTSPLDGLVQIDGTALRLPANAFRAAVAKIPNLSNLLLRYVDTFLFQVSQIAVCNGRHQIEQRAARWILMMHDRVESDSFPMTQETMSVMLGVRRACVTAAIAALQRANLVQHHKGIMRVSDRAGLEGASCECYATVRRRFEWLMAQSSPGT